MLRHVDWAVRAVRPQYSAVVTEGILHDAGEAILDAAPDGMFVVDFDGTIVRVNGQAAALFAASVEELEGASVDSLVPEALRGSHARHRARYSEAPRTRTMGAGLDLVARRLDGTTFPVDIALSPLRIGEETYVVAAVRNVVERRIAERELRLAEERLALLEDRERIARDVHDTVIQEVFASGLNLQAMASRVEDDDLAKRMQETIERLDASITRLRNIIFDLRRPAEGGQLGAAIGEVLSAAAADLGFKPSLTVSGELHEVPPLVEEHLVPTLREALANVARHARASAVSAHIQVGDGVSLVVADDGVGVGDEPSAGFGFTTMTDRAARLGGTCSVQPGDDGGTVVRWTIP